MDSFASSLSGGSMPNQQVYMLRRLRPILLSRHAMLSHPQEEGFTVHSSLDHPISRIFLALVWDPFLWSAE